MNVQEAVTGLVERMQGWLQDLILLLPDLVVALVVALAFALAARVVRKVVHAGLARISAQRSINGLIATSASIAILVVGLFIALGIVGLDKTVTSLLAGVGIIGLAPGYGPGTES